MGYVYCDYESGLGHPCGKQTHKGTKCKFHRKLGRREEKLVAKRKLCAGTKPGTKYDPCGHFSVGGSRYCPDHQ